MASPVTITSKDIAGSASKSTGTDIDSFIQGIGTGKTTLSVPSDEDVKRLLQKGISPPSAAQQEPSDYIRVQELLNQSRAKRAALEPMTFEEFLPQWEYEEDRSFVSKLDALVGNIGAGAAQMVGAAATAAGQVGQQSAEDIAAFDWRTVLFPFRQKVREAAYITEGATRLGAWAVNLPLDVLGTIKESGQRMNIRLRDFTTDQEREIAAKRAYTRYVTALPRKRAEIGAGTDTGTAVEGVGESFIGDFLKKGTPEEQWLSQTVTPEIGMTMSNIESLLLPAAIGRALPSASRATSAARGATYSQRAAVAAANRAAKPVGLGTRAALGAEAALSAADEALRSGVAATAGRIGVSRTTVERAVNVGVAGVVPGVPAVAGLIGTRGALGIPKATGESVRAARLWRTIAGEGRSTLTALQLLARRPDVPKWVRTAAANAGSPRVRELLAIGARAGAGATTEGIEEALESYVAGEAPEQIGQALGGGGIIGGPVAALARISRRSDIAKLEIDTDMLRFAGRMSQPDYVVRSGSPNTESGLKANGKMFDELVERSPETAHAVAFVDDVWGEAGNIILLNEEEFAEAKRIWSSDAEESFAIRPRERGEATQVIVNATRLGPQAFGRVISHEAGHVLQNGQGFNRNAEISQAVVDMVGEDYLEDLRSKKGYTRGEAIREVFAESVSAEAFRRSTRLRSTSLMSRLEILRRKQDALGMLGVLFNPDGKASEFQPVFEGFPAVSAAMEKMIRQYNRDLTTFAVDRKPWGARDRSYRGRDGRRKTKGRQAPAGNPAYDISYLWTASTKPVFPENRTLWPTFVLNPDGTVNTDVPPQRTPIQGQILPENFWTASLPDEYRATTKMLEDLMGENRNQHAAFEHPTKGLRRVIPIEFTVPRGGPNQGHLQIHGFDVDVLQKNVVDWLKSGDMDPWGAARGEELAIKRFLEDVKHPPKSLTPEMKAIRERLMHEGGVWRTWTVEEMEDLKAENTSGLINERPSPLTDEQEAEENRDNMFGPDSFPVVREDRGVTIEAAPDPDDPGRSADWRALTSNQRTRITRELGDEFVPETMRALGIPPEGYRVEYSFGGFEGESNPNIIVHLFPTETLPIDVRDTAVALGAVLNQKAAIGYDETDKTGGSQTDFVRLMFSAPLSEAQVSAVFEEVYRSKISDGYTLVGDEMYFANFSGTDQVVFSQALRSAARRVLPKELTVETQQDRFNSDYITDLQNELKELIQRGVGGPVRPDRPGDGQEIPAGSRRGTDLPVNAPVLRGRSRSLDSLQASFLSAWDARVPRSESPRGTTDAFPTGRRGRGELGTGQVGRGEAPLPGIPTKEGATGPDPGLNSVARDYASKSGIDFRRQSVYAKVNVDRARRIAAEYERMPHAPQDPAVQEAYQDLIRQTRAQYDALTEAGYSFYFYDASTDPYEGNPWNAMRDLRNNKRMAVFATAGGFGTDANFDASDNPLLVDTGLEWPFGTPNGPKMPVTANDLFRAVHDAFGHGLEGAGFRAQGEENAWQAHVRLFQGPAVGALTSETRGQNSWLNYGPHGDTNRTAKVEDTMFADQKTGLMAPWTWEEGRVESEPAGETDAFPSFAGFDSLDPVTGEAGTVKYIQGPNVKARKYTNPNNLVGQAYLERILANQDAPGKERKAAEDVLGRHTETMGQHPGFLAASKNSNPLLRARAIKDQMKVNLRALWDAAELWRERARLWYVGANRIATEEAAKWGIAVKQAAAVLANLSPGKDWFQNVEMGRQVLRAYHEAQNEVIPDKVIDKFIADFLSTAENKKKSRKQKGYIRAAMNQLKGLTLAEMIEKEGTFIGADGKPARDFSTAGMWVRIFAEANYDRTFRVISPEGDTGGIVELKEKGTKEKPGEWRPIGLAWAGFSAIGNALSVLVDPSEARISESIGGAHKVRSFYNNILNPESARGHITVDTHATAAGSLRAIGQSDPMVAQQQGKTSFKESEAEKYRKRSPRATVEGLNIPKVIASIGISGTYWLFADAYRELAAELGVLPRELQSVAWEALRSLFPAKWKRSPKAKEVDAIWLRFDDGEITHQEAIRQIFALAEKDLEALARPGWFDYDFSDPSVPYRGGLVEVEPETDD